MRNRDGVAGLRLLDAHTHIKPRQQVALGVGHLGTQRHLAAGRVHREIGEQQLAGQRVLGAVFQHQPHAGRCAAVGRLELARLHGAAQLERVVGRLREVDVHRIDLLDQRQLRGLALTHQGTFGDQRAADATRNRCRDRGVAQVDVRRLHAGAADRDIGLGGFPCCHGVGIFLLAHCVGFDQRLVSLGQRLGLASVGLGARQAGFGAGGGRCVRCRIDAEQRLALLDVAAFAEQPLLQDAGRASPYLRHARGFQAPGQFCYQTDVARSGDHHADLRRRRCSAAAGRRGLGRIALAARGEEQHHGQADRSGTGR